MTDAPVACLASALEAKTEDANDSASIAKSPPPAKAKGKLPFSLVGAIPSPARAMAGNGAGRNYQGTVTPKNVPFGPPAHAPAVLASPHLTPPPPFHSAAPQEQQQPTTTTMAMLEPMGASYRERLRAGGRGAFQRAIDSGLLPKNMKQEWNGQHSSSVAAQGFLPKQQPEVQSGGLMQYSTLGDNQQMWAAGNDGWSSPMGQAQMQSQQAYAPQQMMQQQMQPQMMLQVPMPQQQAQQPAQMMLQMPAPQEQVQQQVQMAQEPEGDRELMALQLKAAAEMNQCYQD